MVAKEIQTRAILVRVVQNCVVCIHSAEAPSKEEWDGVMQVVADELALGRLRILVSTEGGAPNATQRAKLRDVLGHSKPPIAVMSSSSLVRAVCTAISWFNPQMRQFPPESLPAALDHLGIPLPDRAALVRGFEEAKAELRSGSARAASRA